LAKAVLQQGCTAPVVPMQRFDPDQRQIPMGLGWPIVFGPLEDRGDFGLLLPTDASRNNRLEHPIIAVNTRWEPDRDPKAVTGALRCSCCKRACCECSE
jgi:hypothetical protein